MHNFKKLHLKETQTIKKEAQNLGFYRCGISKAEYLKDESQKYKSWLSKGFHAGMQYMENHFEKRLDPTKLIEGAKSIISLLYPYYPQQLQNPETPVISKYAYGKDYHYVIKEKLEALFDFINKNITEISGRYFVDSAPVPEKVWAQKAGLGWIGKNSNLITKKGSFFFISELIIDVDSEYDAPAENHCGSCTKCIDACPVNAIVEPYVIDSNKCISYLTIENKGDIPEHFKDKFRNRVFGCDICQDVCPFNNKAVIHNENQFIPHPELLEMNRDDFENMTKEEFNKIFKDSAVKRAKFSGFKRNLDFLKTI